MQAIVSTFGIDWRLLLINAVNFGILMAALWYFLYEPVMRMLEERRRKVSEGVAAAAEAEKRLAEVESSRQHVLAQAGADADQIVAEARAAAQEKGRQIVADAETSAQAALKDAQAQADELKERAVRESKEEVAKLIVLGMERAIANK
jgi:F-type H+-transporting ATPase subunit b